MTMSSVIEKNNQTIAFFNASDYLNAIESSTLALSSLQQEAELESSENNEEESNIDESSHAAESGIDRLDQCVLQTAVSEYRASIQTGGSCDFIYDHGISIPTSVKVDTDILSAIAIFNSALAHHLAAESLDTPTSTEALQKAQRLYHLAYHVDTSSRSLLFQFAVINNLGVVERKLGNTSVSNQCFDYLAYLLENTNFEDQQV
eukprot:CAMPEP_0113658906 /NCGR_PEP_ID=MMETSP0017_2-20120614/32032_1 /TAXON_ID=2856 /ORGANISM="Cylindrotheca closterium" /LENGTH=203 /DNA_ID=CAMNT_0000573337 /DNA_START=71 /DNA_END=682 /DNA_ORIENTATION=- /assembly_acc=CAM_ASM_000147